VVELFKQAASGWNLIAKPLAREKRKEIEHKVHIADTQQFFNDRMHNHLQDVKRNYLIRMHALTYAQNTLLNWHHQEQLTQHQEYRDPSSHLHDRMATPYHL
jgi:hypothetical protein